MQLKQQQRLISTVFEGHYYEQIDQIGEGGQATVYWVLLRDVKTDRVKNIYAAKIVT